MRRLTLLAAVAVGLLAGIGGFTFVYARGASYMTNDPQACANCHVMQEHYAAWLKSSHRAVAVCNDCHAPHDLVGKYLVKAENGWRHSVAFTTGRHPDPMRITPRNARVTERACRDCHADMVAAMSGRGEEGVPRSNPNNVAIEGHAEPAGSEAVSCIHCHRNVGHWVR
jgi:cytochrome c nitrite reductase small subunit